MYSIKTIFEGVLLFMGLWMISKLLWLCIIQAKYKGESGEDYLKYGKKYVEEKYGNSKK